MFQNLLDPSSAQATLKSALSLNSKLIRPLDGIKYQKLANIYSQAEKCREFLNQCSDNPNNLLIRLNAVLEDLTFIPKTSNAFEKAIMEIGRFLGFDSQRPENEYGKGPDNLWSCGNLTFFVIECKNGCTSNKINKHDTNQINGLINWFSNEYDDTCVQYPVLIHPELRFENAASPNRDIRIMTPEKLEGLKEAVYTFVMSCIQSGQIADLDKIRRALRDNHLVPEALKDQFTEGITV